MRVILDFIEYKLVGFPFFLYVLFCIICALACVGVIGEITTKRKVAILKAKHDAKVAEEERKAAELIKKGSKFQQTESVIDPSMVQASKPVKRTPVVNTTNPVTQPVNSVSPTPVSPNINQTVGQGPVNNNTMTSPVNPSGVVVDAVDQTKEEVPAVLVLDDVKPVDSK